MSLKPVNWSVVIVGRWNRAILTPAGIAKRIFKTAGEQELYVMVPLDGISPFVVRDPSGDVSVMTDESRLFIRVENPTYECLQRAMAYGVNAMDSLEQTPVSAAGFNVNYQCDELSPELASLIVADVDKPLAKSDLKLTGTSAVTRSFEFHSGQLGLTLNATGNTFQMLGNFHRSSTVMTDLKSWLQTPMADVRSAVENLLNALDLSIEEPQDVSDG